MHLDVAVIGASSSGLYAAEQLSRAGLRVGVFEQHDQVNPARRTLITTPEILEYFDSFPEAAVLNRIHRMNLASPGSQASVKFLDPDLIVERGQFTRFLARRAAEAGVTIFLNHRFQSLAPHASGVILKFQSRAEHNGSVTAAAVIGADGALTHLAPAAGLERPPRVPILQAEIRLPADWDPGVTQVWFDVTKTRYFFWLIPESESHGVVGLVGNGQGTNIRALLARFMNQHDLEALAYQGAQVALYHPRLRPWGKVGTAPVYLIGDAAGQVKVSTVGGTVSGFWGANAAVRSILDDTSYASNLRGLHRELLLHWGIWKLLGRLDNAGYDQLVDNVEGRVSRFLGRHHRDDMAGVFWQLPLHQPRLLGLLPRLLFSPRSSISSQGVSHAADLKEL